MKVRDNNIVAEYFVAGGRVISVGDLEKMSSFEMAQYLRGHPKDIFARDYVRDTAPPGYNTLVLEHLHEMIEVDDSLVVALS